MLNTYLNIYFISYNIKLYEQIFNFIKKDYYSITFNRF